MSTKTIAVDSEVYGKLARLKKESESFSKLLNRLVDDSHTSHTVAGVLAALDDAPLISDDDAAAMENVVARNRRDENWASRDLS